MGGLFFDLHFNLANTHNELLDFLKDYRYSDVRERSYYDSINFVKTPIPILADDLSEKKENLFYKELEGMYNEIRLELQRRLNVLVKLQEYNDEFITDWRLVSIFNNAVIEMRQSGMFAMINNFLEEYKMQIGRRIQSSEKYQPFTPIISGKEVKNHSEFRVFAANSAYNKQYSLWLRKEEQYRINLNHKRINNEEGKLSKVVPDNIVIEKLFPKIIAENSFDMNVHDLSETEIESRLSLEGLYYSLDEN